MQKIIPHLWFDNQVEEAVSFYTSTFPNSKITSRRTLHDTPSGDSEVISFELDGQPFMAINGGPLFKFNEAISLIVNCETQKEVDYYWEKLSADPKAEVCGWLKDKFGLSWQIVPTAMGRMMSDGSEDQIARLTAAFLKMKKLDIAELEKAYLGQ